MKIAISADGNHLDATVNPRFGRCPFFLIVETDDMGCEALANANADVSSGAGIQAASTVVDKGARVVITGSCGPKAMQVFAEAGIPVILNQHGRIRDVVAQFKGGALISTANVNATDAVGSVSSGGRPAMGVGRGRGLGGGRGVGGCGRGMGLGGGRGAGRRCGGVDPAGVPMSAQPAGVRSKDEERRQLQQQAEACKQQLAAIEDRIKALA